MICLPISLSTNALPTLQQSSCLLSLACNMRENQGRLDWIRESGCTCKCTGRQSHDCQDRCCGIHQAGVKAPTSTTRTFKIFHGGAELVPQSGYLSISSRPKGRMDDRLTNDELTGTNLMTAFCYLVDIWDNLPDDTTGSSPLDKSGRPQDI